MVETKKPTQLLSDEHKAVLQKLTALEKVFGNLDKKEAVAAELKELTTFFKAEFWVHFTKEEEALFPEIETFLPRDAGPLGVMLMEHEDLRKTNDIIQKATAEYLGNEADASRAGHSLHSGVERPHQQRGQYPLYDGEYAPEPAANG